MADSILQHQLEKLAADRYPLHMPGHKRHLAPAPGLSCYAWDIWTRFLAMWIIQIHQNHQL